MGVHIDEPRGDPAITGIDHERFGCRFSFSDPPNAACLDIDVSIVMALSISRQDGGITKQDRL